MSSKKQFNRIKATATSGEDSEYEPPEESKKREGPKSKARKRSATPESESESSKEEQERFEEGQKGRNSGQATKKFWVSFVYICS